jgi:hypothetical protein
MGKYGLGLGLGLGTMQPRVAGRKGSRKQERPREGRKWSGQIMRLVVSH